jgi:hypothetical protein
VLEKRLLRSVCGKPRPGQFSKSQSIVEDVRSAAATFAVCTGEQLLRRGRGTPRLNDAVEIDAGRDKSDHAELLITLLMLAEY